MSCVNPRFLKASWGDTGTAVNKGWITDGMNGFLVAIDDGTSLAHKIIQFLRNEGLAEQARQKNWKMVRETAYLKHHMEHLHAIYGPYVR